MIIDGEVLPGSHANGMVPGHVLKQLQKIHLSGYEGLWPGAAPLENASHQPPVYNPKSCAPVTGSL